MKSRLLRITAVLAMAALLSACGKPAQPEMRGFLFFAVGNYLAQLDLRDGSTSVAANLGDAEIQSISPQLDERLLLTVYGNVNQQDMHRLVLYDIESPQTLTLLNGRHGHYLPGTKTLVYDDGSRIMVAERVRGTWEKTEVYAHRYNAQLQILPISATRFLYSETGGPLWLYDNVSARSIALDELSELCQVDYALWLPDREQFLCRTPGDDGSYRYPFVSLDGQVDDSLPLPGSKSFRPMAWLPDQDALVLTEQWQGWMSDTQKSAVWIYRFEDGSMFRLVEDQHVGDFVIYRSG